ncbi:GTPase of the mitochondrial inner membrane that associates with the large ribosomal subunit [Recurvomyces mirabilis]|uniref:GTPase of the mitochondrial inner membrane that associates with the large ribosomal subunit n=1 Tax=Recurvomyces mirabilis TaxID=574656 RepID=A0AAE0WK98_9PEZI|nr:GTPase of the mitochondrial inner membrane that associates with the large ribosomal subunit [Recurvomyces mirabilis]KAK5153210.1 GTPase of the mitochondrial inner membrane that associates with the large ribosomal subunit [Recurvomyces mirabilis]
MVVAAEVAHAQIYVRDGDEIPSSSVDVSQYDPLTPVPPDYSSTPFTDTCTLTISSGPGGHGCISFLREKYIANGPPNGGDGGTGGNVYIQAVRGETSLHKIARRGTLKAGRGRNGQGSLRGGVRGEDVVLHVPVGTVVREIWRKDPLEDDARLGGGKGYGQDLRDDDPEAEGTDQTRKWRRDKWLLYPGTLPKSFTSADFPALPRPRKNNLVATCPPAPLRLDLSAPMSTPQILAAGAMGGLGNPHFVTKSITKPKYATKGEESTRIHLQLELKLLADVGLVGLPNAGKSTLLRALTNSRTRVGSWAFTTLAPSVGTVVLDSFRGRPGAAGSAAGMAEGARRNGRTHFTIADIPGLVPDAHLDRGLGLGFLRHVERAGVLAFVIDLSAADPVEGVKGLWREVGMFEQLREQERFNGSAEGLLAENLVADENIMVEFKPFESSISPGMDPEPAHHQKAFEEHEHGYDAPPANIPTLPPLQFPAITIKPWFVVATKADLPETQEAFATLRTYLEQINSGKEAHPSSKAGKDVWNGDVRAVPVCAMRKEGVEGVLEVMGGLLPPM